jgi:hypothetical protein
LKIISDFFSSLSLYIKSAPLLKLGAKGGHGEKGENRVSSRQKCPSVAPPHPKAAVQRQDALAWRPLE